MSSTNWDAGGTALDPNIHAITTNAIDPGQPITSKQVDWLAAETTRAQGGAVLGGNTGQYAFRVDAAMRGLVVSSIDTWVAAHGTLQSWGIPWYVDPSANVIVLDFLVMAQTTMTGTPFLRCAMQTLLDSVVTVSRFEAQLHAAGAGPQGPWRYGASSTSQGPVQMRMLRAHVGFNPDRIVAAGLPANRRVLLVPQIKITGADAKDREFAFYSAKLGNYVYREE